MCLYWWYWYWYCCWGEEGGIGVTEDSLGLISCTISTLGKALAFLDLKWPLLNGLSGHTGAGWWPACWFCWATAGGGDSSLCLSNLETAKHDIFVYTKHITTRKSKRKWNLDAVIPKLKFLSTLLWTVYSNFLCHFNDISTREHCKKPLSLRINWVKGNAQKLRKAHYLLLQQLWQNWEDERRTKQTFHNKNRWT